MSEDKDKIVSHRIVEILQEMGYRASMPEDDLIKSAAQGLNFQITVYGRRSIQCWLGVADISHAVFSDSDIADFNRAFRFAKLYPRVEEGNRSLLLEQDFLVDALADDAPDRLREIIGTWDVSVGNFAHAMRAAAQQSRSLSEAG